MRRTAVLVCALCAELLAPRSAAAAVYYGFTVGVSGAPRPPAIRMVREPHAMLTGDAMVYVVDDAALRFDGDLFHYGQYWFAYTRGYWYRARAHHGPYAVIDVKRVPRAIIGVPRRMWKHHPLATAPAKAASANVVASVRAPRITPVPRPATMPAGGSVHGRPLGPPAPPAVSARAARETLRSRRGSAR